MSKTITTEELRAAAIDASLKPENKGKWCTAIAGGLYRNIIGVHTSNTIKEARDGMKWERCVHAKNGAVHGERVKPEPKPESQAMTDYRAALVELDHWRNAEKTKIDSEYEARLKALKAVKS